MYELMMDALEGKRTREEFGRAAVDRGDDDVLTMINELQGVQKRCPVQSSQWRRASGLLHVLFNIMAARTK